MTPEGKIKRKVSAMLKSFGDKVWYLMPVKHPRFGSKSLDYICCVNGWFVAIETKKDKNSKLTKLQEVTVNNITKVGGTFFLVYNEVSLDSARDCISYLVDHKPRITDDHHTHIKT